MPSTRDSIVITLTTMLERKRPVFLCVGVACAIVLTLCGKGHILPDLWCAYGVGVIVVC